MQSLSNRLATKLLPCRPVASLPPPAAQLTQQAPSAKTARGQLAAERDSAAPVIPAEQMLEATTPTSDRAVKRRPQLFQVTWTAAQPEQCTQTGNQTCGVARRGLRPDRIFGRSCERNLAWNYT